ncbi:MetQ/NlpA family ABC transporter substrate-binding protein [Salinibacterium sp. M195]|uniref:MetQ/NlpA family ABC transporter substrate-binding protein n=1 Tax=Salinibacterium sp. M195 TaxID=2583374 RepID=UPI001C626A3F|nr:MetQ/NlpA family ABC transporter substrate-binding protein [Salinibacterium sp. M195]QYH36969.1 methionine ABC transporter substrate-binding protein [Salinibacterium sp. M195]
MSEQTPLISAPKKRGKLYALIAAGIVVAIAIITAIVLAVTSSGGDDVAPVSPGDDSDTAAAITEGKGSSADPVTIGVVGASDPYWEVYKDAAAAEGISIDLVDFGSYELPNPALTAGDLDLNQFQHIIYLAQYNEAAGADLAPIGATAIYPLGLYSTQFGSLEEIPAGSTVAVPNDASNLARSLLVLQSAGLIELDGGGSIFVTLDDIKTDTSKVKVIALEAALAPTSLPDVAAAIINNDFVEDAGLSFSDAIATDDPSDANAVPYINIFAARADDANNELYLQLVDIFQSTQAVQDGVLEVSGNTAVLLQTPVGDLVDSLSTVQSDIRAQG